MTYLQAILLGLVQGLTEFLPVSSSGHLVLGGQVLGVEDRTDVLFEVLVHMGTLVAILVVFRARIAGLLGAAIGKGTSENRRLLGLLVVGTVPAGVADIALEDFFETLFSSVLSVSVALIVTGLILRAARERKDASGNLGWAQVFAVGMAQAAAITPGISRSGATIAMALRLGITQTAAAELSFLLAIPTIGGAFVLKLGDVAASHGSGTLGPYLVGMGVAALSGWGALRWLLVLLRRGKFHHFSWYCWAVGGVGVLCSICSQGV